MNLFGRGKDDKQLTVAEYLEHMSRAFVTASLAGPAVIQEVLREDALDAEIPLGDHIIKTDSATWMPEGFFDLDELEIECESGVEVAKDADGTPIGLAMTMRRGLVSRGMHVKFKAKYVRKGKIESVEILRDAGNDLLRRELERTNIKAKQSPTKRE